MKGTVNMIFFCAYMLGLFMGAVSSILADSLTWWGHLIIIMPLTYLVFMAGMNMAYSAIVRELTQTPGSDTL